jgi:tetratricopeptide (TPR) repeat protein
MSDEEMGKTQSNSAEKSSSTRKFESIQTPGSSELREETQTTDSSSDNNTEKPKRFRRMLGLIVGLIVFLALGALGGVQSGLNTRQDKEQLDKAVEAVAQFELGKIDLDSGQCDIARQRFEYVIQLDPSFPGLAEKLADSILCAGLSSEASLLPTAAATPTPDQRGADEIFSQLDALMASENWDEVLLNLDSLRKNFPDYLPIEVDGYYYTALRNRGISRILGPGELESGIFDLNQAEKIGPLDSDAVGTRQWAIWYIVGQSFWEVDWASAVQYFSQIAPQAPNLHDINFFTAQDRLITAQTFYAEDLVDLALFYAGAKGWCDAQSLMSQADGYSPHSPELQPTAAWIIEKCTLNPDEQPRITPAP